MSLTLYDSLSVVVDSRVTTVVVMTAAVMSAVRHDDYKSRETERDGERGG